MEYIRMLAKHAGMAAFDTWPKVAYILCPNAAFLFMFFRKM